MFNQGAQRVAMGSNEHIFLSLDSGKNAVFPIGHHTHQGVFERLGERDICRGKIPVARVFPWETLIVWG